MLRTFKGFLLLTSAFFISAEVSFAAPVLPKNSTIFVIPTIADSKQQNVFQANASTTDKEYSIKVPVKQPDGSYKLVEVTYKETDTTRTITMPGEGSVSVVKDDNGDYNFTVTPEQIKDSNNVTCQVKPDGNGKCTIEPFLVLSGDKVISADKLVVDYTEGQDLKVAGGTATNLKLLSKDSKTEINKSETNLGDTQVQVKFESEGSVPDLLNGEKIETKNLQISLNTAKLVHTVTNPKNPSDVKTKFQIKDGGVSSNIVIDNQDHAKLSLTATTQGGINYNSDPFSSKNLTIDTTGAIKGSLNLDNDPTNPSASLNLSIEGKDKNGELSKLTIVDKRKDNETTTINSFGETFVNAAGTSKEDLTFEVGSDYLFYENKNANGKTETAEIAGLLAKGKANDYSLTALSANYKKPGLEIKTGSLAYAMTEDDQAKRHAALLNHAYYNSGDIDAKLHGETTASMIEYKDPKTAETFNGRAIKSDLALIGSNMEFSQEGTTLNLSGGVVARQLELQDKGQVFGFSGNSGSVSSQDYSVKLDQNFNILYEVDTKGDPKAVQFSSGSITGDSQESQFKMFNSTTSANFFGKSDAGKNIFSVAHTSDGIKFSDNKNELSSEQNTLSYIDADKVKYGAVSFDKLNYLDKESNGKLEIVGAELAVYSDTTDPTKNILQGEFSLEKLKAEALDYSISVTAKDANGIEGKYKIFYFQEGNNKQFKIFGEDGRQVFLEGSDKNNTHAELLLGSLEYFESDKFKAILGTNIAGKLKNVDPKSEELISFNIGRVEGIQSLNPDYREFTIQNGTVSQVTPTQNIEASFGSANYLSVNQNGETTTMGSLGSGVLKGTQNGTSAVLDFASLDFLKNGSGQAVSAKNVNAVVNDKNGNLILGGANLEATDSNSVLYGKGSLKNLSYESKNKDKVTILGAQVVFYSDKSVTEAQADISKLSAESKEYSVDVMAKDLNGKEGKFKIYVYEDGSIKNYKIFAEDGHQVKIDASLKDNQHAQVLLESVEYLQSEGFQSALAKNVSGTLKTTEASATFALGELSYVGNDQVKVGSITNAQVNGEMKDMNANVSASKLNFSEMNTLDTKQLYGELTQGVVKVVKGNQEAQVSVGSLVGAQISTPKGESITIVSGKNMDLVAVDYDELMKVSGTLGELNYYKDAKIQRIELKDLKNLSLEDLNNKITATINANGLLMVDTPEGSYVLINSATLEAKEAQNGISAHLRVGVLELLNDKLSGQNVILKADVEGKVTLDKTKSPVAAEVNFALKGQNLTTASQSYVSSDGNTVSKLFSIKTVNESGHLENLKLTAGPSFLKDAISIEAKGGQNGKSLNFTIVQDKSKGTYFVRAEFIEGEKVKVKLLPFTLESKIQGGDAVAELLLTPKGQNFYNHMEIITSVVSPQELTSWLGVADGGLLIARTGTLGGFGFEMMYQNKDKFIPPSQRDFDPTKNKTNSYGAAIYHENDKGDRTSVGMMLTGDSEFDYQTNGRGVLKIMGQDMAQSGRIPGTLNLYMKKDFADGDNFYGGVFVDTTSFTVDPKRLAQNASYFDGGRSAGKFGASAAYSKKLSERSRLTVAAGVNNNFQDPAVCITYTRSLGGSSSEPIKLTRDTMDIINHLPSGNLPGTPDGFRSATSILEADIEDLKKKYENTVVLEKIRNALRDVVNAVKDGKVDPNGFKKLSAITEKDLEALHKLEERNYIPGRYSDKIRDLVKLVKENTPEQAILKSGELEAKNLRQTMDELAREFGSSTSASVYDEYMKKVRMLHR